MEAASDGQHVVANGDYSCDSAFVGVGDEAAFQSAAECVAKLRQKFERKLEMTIGDHELGKMSLFGGRGGMRLASWQRSQRELNLRPFWTKEIGRYVLVGVTSSLIALPVYEPETLIEERIEWQRLRKEHLTQIRGFFKNLDRHRRVILFCHDPTALPFLWRDEIIRARLNQIEHTIIGHLHSKLFLWNSRLLSGVPTIGFLGNSIRRMSAALREAKCWRKFRLELCPSLGGIQLLGDGGYCSLKIDPTANRPAELLHHCL